VKGRLREWHAPRLLLELGVLALILWGIPASFADRWPATIACDLSNPSTAAAD